MAKQNEKKAKGAGGKLARSEIIQARLSPKIRFTVEMLSRLERRTVSSLIETLIDDAAKNYQTKIIIGTGSRKTKNCALADAVTHIWHTEESVRLVGLALAMPDLLTPEEEKICSLIFETNYFWKCVKVKLINHQGKELGIGWSPIYTMECLIKKHLLEYWPQLQRQDVNYQMLPPSTKIGEKIMSLDGNTAGEKIIEFGSISSSYHLQDLNDVGREAWIDNIKKIVERHNKVTGKPKKSGLTREHIASLFDYELKAEKAKSERESDDN